MNAPIQHRVFANTSIRPVKSADVSRLLQLAMEMYPGRGVEGGLEWAEWCRRQPNYFVWAGDDSLIIAHIYKRYGFELRAQLDMLCARRSKKAILEALYLVKAAKRWAAVNGVTHPMRIDSDTGVDFGPFARRLGGRKIDPAYEIPVDGGSL